MNYRDIRGFYDEDYKTLKKKKSVDFIQKKVQYVIFFFLIFKIILDNYA